MTEIIIFILEIIGTIAFAISGALVGIQKRMDIFGVIILGCVTAVGGGIIRDICLGVLPPQVFINPIYVLIAAITSLIFFLPIVNNYFVGTKNHNNKQSKADLLLNIVDSLGLAVFTIAGMSTAAELSNNSFLAVFVGVATGVAGGLIRDLLAQKIPDILYKRFYACSAIIGALCAVLLNMIIDNWLIVDFISITIIFILRMLATKYKWELPKAKTK